MPHMDIFNNDAFRVDTLTQAINTMPFVPQFLGSLGIFEVKPVRTEFVSIEKRGNTLALIPTSPRGAPLDEGGTTKRNIRVFQTSRIAKGDTIQAAEIQGIRAFGSESELQSVEAEVAMRQANLLRDVELTWENMRLGALMGVVKDADGSTIYDWFTEWGIAPPSAIDFNLDSTTTNIRALCHDLSRVMERAAGGAFTPSTQIHALCGDAFFDAFVTHPMVERIYLNQPQAAALSENQAWRAFYFGKIYWHNYRGTDDNTTLKVATDEAKFFPVGAAGVFQAVFSPGEMMHYANTLGLPLYSLIVPDLQRNMWARPEVYSYPLFICTRPEVLLKAVRT